MTAMPRTLWIGAALCGLVAAAVAIGGDARPAADPVVALPILDDTPPCGSCTARHQHLTRAGIDLSSQAKETP